MSFNCRGILADGGHPNWLSRTGKKRDCERLRVVWQLTTTSISMSRTRAYFKTNFDQKK
jgi:hypothetical protein